MEAKSVSIIIGDDDLGHATLVKMNLMDAGIKNNIIHLKNGQEILDFFWKRDTTLTKLNNTPYLLLLDINMPKVDGIEVLRRIKEDKELKKMPIIMLTTTDDPEEIEKCHSLGCNGYVTKPVEYERFIEVVKKLGLYLNIMQIPNLH